MTVLPRLARYALLKTEDAAELQAAYVFLRDIEHRLQMEAGRQTHTIPTERRPRLRLAKLMGCETLAEFEAARRKHSGNVRRIYDQILPGEEAPDSSLPPEDMEAYRRAVETFIDRTRLSRTRPRPANAPAFSQRTGLRARFPAHGGTGAGIVAPFPGPLSGNGRDGALRHPLEVGRSCLNLPANPKGIESIQPRVARNELPWVNRKQDRRQPLKGLNQLRGQALRQRSNPFRVRRK